MGGSGAPPELPSRASEPVADSGNVTAFRRPPPPGRSHDRVRTGSQTAAPGGADLYLPRRGLCVSIRYYLALRAPHAELPSLRISRAAEIVQRVTIGRRLGGQSATPGIMVPCSSPTYQRNKISGGQMKRSIAALDMTTSLVARRRVRANAWTRSSRSEASATSPAFMPISAAPGRPSPRRWRSRIPGFSPRAGRSK